MTSPTISVVLTAYNAEQFISESLAAILDQAHPPDEIVVVDDGSTDDTPAELARFGAAIRVIRQANAGHPAALNRACQEARGAYLAKCDADDVWRRDKLERQVAALRAHPEIDIAFSAVWVFGSIEGPWGLSSVDDPGVGILEPERLARSLYRKVVICPSSTLIRRSLFETLGPFAPFPGEDYDFWLRALRGRAVFHYDPAFLVRYRRHDRQQTSDALGTHRANYHVRGLHADVVDDADLVRTMRAMDLFKIGRLLVDERRPREARRAFRGSLRNTTAETRSAAPRALGWLVVLGLPERARDHGARVLVGASRGLDQLRGGVDPARP